MLVKNVVLFVSQQAGWGPPVIARKDNAWEEGLPGDNQSSIAARRAKRTNTTDWLNEQPPPAPEKVRSCMDYLLVGRETIKVVVGTICTLQPGYTIIPDWRHTPYERRDPGLPGEHGGGHAR